ncbi:MULTISPECIES: hypothetical protein [unclassified Crossiella]|uniref:hypothetical protein n=1 Tax=unclassified Crossiella TaxID=2620835 RepID=UPI001FFF8C4A|nr:MULTISPECIES: hypothetical protein [unclassified Crossiella]MCK2237612.1 hypothetical protein [Crossiella sp. S99.2]MCK2254898.1 hypothetical protein [Crossiella sp. S99.1]
MAEHSERRRHRVNSVLTRARIVTAVAAALRWIGTIIAVVLVAHVVLTVGGANPANAITRFVAGWADPLALGFRDLFMPEDPKARILVNYGLAALFWLIVTALVVKIIRRLG